MQKDLVTTKIRKKLKYKRKKLHHNSSFSNPFTIEEIIKAISCIKAGKAAVLDHIHPEFIINCGPKVIVWQPLKSRKSWPF